MLDTEKKRNLWIGILFVVVLSVFIVCYGKMQKPEEPITATAFKLNTVVKVTIYDSQETVDLETLAFLDTSAIVTFVFIVPLLSKILVNHSSKPFY